MSSAEQLDVASFKTRVGAVEIILVAVDGVCPHRIAASDVEGVAFTLAAGEHGFFLFTGQRDEE